MDLDFSTTKIGFIGLGAMGSGMASNLKKKIRHLFVYDIDEVKTLPLVESGAYMVSSTAEIVKNCNIIMTSLPHPEVFRKVFIEDILPLEPQNRLFIGFGTATREDTVMIAESLASSGSLLLDSPVSGGVGGAAAGTLRIFVGGSLPVYQEALPLLRLVGDPERIVYCGPSGTGQIVKAVNQLMMGLSNAAVLESIAYGLNQGINEKILDKAVGGTDNSVRQLFSTLLHKIGRGEGDSLSIKYGQLTHFLKSYDFGELPVTEALISYLKKEERTVMDVNRLSPSFWKKITRKGE